MKERLSGKSKLLLSVLVCLFLVMLLFSCMTPLVADDFSYKFSWADNARIRSPLQIAASMAVHRQITNGRVIAHSLVQLLLMLPKAVFNVLNALNCVLMALLALRHFRGGARSALLLLCGAFMVWNYMPAFGQVFLWLDGAVNYSWGLSLFLLFLWPYAAAWMDKPCRRRTGTDILFLFAAFLAGAYSENGSVSAIFAALCLTGLTALRQRRLRARPLIGIAAACLGFVFLASAPAMQGRASSLDFSSLAANARTILSATQEQLGVLYGIYAVCLALCLAAGADKRKVLLSVVYILSGLASLSAFVFAAYFTPRHFCFTVAFTVLACLLLLSALLDMGRKAFPAALTGLMAALFLFNFLLGALDIAVIFSKSLQRERAVTEALAAGERDIALEIYVPSTKYSAPFQLLDLNPAGEGWPNDSLALYYGFDSVTGYYP